MIVPETIISVLSVGHDFVSSKMADFIIFHYPFDISFITGEWKRPLYSHMHSWLVHLKLRMSQNQDLYGVLDIIIS